MVRLRVFREFLDFITALICQLLTIWNFDDIAPLLLKPTSKIQRSIHQNSERTKAFF